eukprot:Nk52_evm9s2256 gene=Nk52_evmTU9s2256
MPDSRILTNYSQNSVMEARAQGDMTKLQYKAFMQKYGAYVMHRSSEKVEKLLFPSPPEKKHVPKPGTFYFWDHCKSNDELVEYINNNPLESPDSIVDENGNTALHLVRSPEMALTLCKIGMNPNAKNNKGQSPLGFHFEENEDALPERFEYKNFEDLREECLAEVAMVLLHHGAEYEKLKLLSESRQWISKEDFTGENAEEEYRMSVNANLEHYPDLMVTLLPFAVSKCHTRLVQLLLQWGADPNTQEYGKVAMMFCNKRSNTRAKVGNEYFRIVELLLEHKADPNAHDYGTTQFWFGRYTGANILMAAHWSPNVVKILLEHGAIPEIRHPVDTWGCYSCNNDVLRLFVDNIPKESINNFISGFGGIDRRINRLWWVFINLRENKMEIAKALIKRGADICIQNEYNENILMYVGRAETVQFFLESKVDANIVSTYGQTPLSYAIRHSSPETIKLLLDYGAKTNLSSMPEMLYAIENENCNLETIHLLLEHGCDPNRADISSKTPLMATRKLEQAELLVKYGADIAIKDNNGRMACQYIMDLHNDRKTTKKEKKELRKVFDFLKPVEKE